MEVVEVSRSKFMHDYEKGCMTVEQLKNKYNLNNRSYYELLEQFGIKKRVHKIRKIVVVD